MSESSVVVSSPGRVCLFGEHQDYLGLPVIAAAISRRIWVHASRTDTPMIRIDLPDIGAVEEFRILERIPYTRKADYFRSSVNVLREHGMVLKGGVEARVRGNIPIKAGTSSSSAMVVSWLHALWLLAGNASPSPRELGQAAYEAEVREFSEAGGMMDQFTSAYGGTVWIASVPAIAVERLPALLKPFVLGNSQQPKDTQGILARVKNGVLELVDRILRVDPAFSLQTAQQPDLERYGKILSREERTLLEGTLSNRDITRDAKDLLSAKDPDHRRIGDLLLKQHAILRDILRISTRRIDAMIDAAMHAGAAGAKINGSGGGGCMFAYAPEKTEEILEAVARIAPADVVTADDGSRMDLWP